MADETKNAAREALAETLCREYHPMHWDVAYSYGRRAKPCHACKTHADAILASPALDAIVAERVAELGEEMPPRMAKAWGGDSRWLTTGSNVAALVGDWLREEAADLAEWTAER